MAHGDEQQLKSILDHMRLSAISEMAQIADPDKIEKLKKEVDGLEAARNGLSRYIPKTLDVLPEPGTIGIDRLPSIPIQCGVRPDEVRNGYLDTEILDGVLRHLKGFMKPGMASKETAEAIKSIESAIKSLRDRVSRRKLDGTYGTNEEKSPLKHRAITFHGNKA